MVYKAKNLFLIYEELTNKLQAKHQRLNKLKGIESNQNKQKQMDKNNGISQ